MILAETIGIFVLYIKGKTNQFELLWIMMVMVVVGMYACNRVMTRTQVCETGPLHLSSLTMNGLQRGQLHHR